MAKRQLGLAEAFKNAAPAQAGPARPAKRARTASPPPPPTTTTKTTTATVDPPAKLATNNGNGAKTAPVTLPATGFSAAEWRASLSTESPAPHPSDADLLALEARTLHPSWLRHLHEELRKPYFLDLKRFLWSEGLQGTQDRQGGKLKVFPPGALGAPRASVADQTPPPHLRVLFILLTSLPTPPAHSPRRICLEPVYAVAERQGSDSRAGPVSR